MSEWRFVCWKCMVKANIHGAASIAILKRPTKCEVCDGDITKSYAPVPQKTFDKIKAAVKKAATTQLAQLAEAFYHEGAVDRVGTILDVAQNPPPNGGSDGSIPEDLYNAVRRYHTLCVAVGTARAIAHAEFKKVPR